MSHLPPQDDRLRLLDQRVREILQSSGGWNATARARLLWFGVQKRVDVGALVASVRRVAAAPEDTASLPEVPATRLPDSEGGSSPPVAGRSNTSRVGLAVVAAVGGVGLSLTAALVWWALVSAPAPGPAVPAPVPTAGPGGSPDRSTPLLPGRESPSAGSGPAPAPVGGAAPPVAAIYPRVPALRADRAPSWATTALESLSADEAELERTAAQLSGGGAPSDADRAAWARASKAFVASWPLLDSRRRQADVAALVAMLPRLGDAATRRTLTDPLESWRSASDPGAESLWRGAGAAGLMASVEAGGADGFAPAALGWLVPRAVDVAGSAADAPAARAADAVVAYIEALDAAGAQPASRPARDAAIVRALDTLIRRGAPLDRPSVAADAAGTLLDSLPWGGEPARRTALADALAAWCLDPSVPSLPLHGLTSVLAARRPGAWWEPWLVVGSRADAAERSRTAERFRAALAAASEPQPSVAAPRITGVAQETVLRWLRAAKGVDSRAPSTDPAVRLAYVAERIALVEAARLLERGRASDAVARIAQVEDPAALAPDDQDRWKDRQERPAARPASDDGGLEDELRARRTLDARVAAIKQLRTRAAGDLGPRDALVLAHEAVSAPNGEIRAAAAGVIADAFANGPETVRALASEMATALFVADAARLAALVAGEPVARGTDDQLRSASTLMLLDHLATLEPSERHRIDSVSRELTLSAAAIVRAMGREPPASALPEDAMAAWFAARSSEARPLVPPASMAALDARAAWRRRLAHPGPQAWVAETASLAELEAVLVAERLPRRRADVEAVVRRAAQARAAAVDVFAQADANARALLELARIAIDPDGGGT